MENLLLTTTFPPHTGGIAAYLEGLARTLGTRGHDLEVVACGVSPPAEPPRSRPRPYGLRYVEGATPPFGGRAGEACTPLRKLSLALLHVRRCLLGRRMVASMLDRMDDQPPGVCVGVWNEIAHGWCSGLRRRGVPYRIFAYGLEVVRPLDVVRRRWRIDDFRSAEVVYACSRATADLLRRRVGQVDVRVVYPGVTEPTDRGAVDRDSGRLREDLGIAPDERVLVTVGRLVRRKGVHRVLRALGACESEGACARYVVAGDGPERGRLENLCHDLGLERRVDFLGRVDEQTKWAVYELGDLFLMPLDEPTADDWEGFGIVLLEAAVMGLPAVAGSGGGAAEAVRHGVTGYLVEPGDQEELIAAVRALLRDPEVLRRMGVAARERARTEFTWDRAADDLLMEE